MAAADGSMAKKGTRAPGVRRPPVTVACREVPLTVIKRSHDEALRILRSSASRVAKVGPDGRVEDRPLATPKTLLQLRHSPKAHGRVNQPMAIASARQG